MSDYKYLTSKPGKLSKDRYDVYDKLTHLFKRGIGTTQNFKPQQLDPTVKRTTRDHLTQQFQKAGADNYMRLTSIDPDRFRSFEDFDAMDYTPEIASALDIYADESCTKNEFGEILKISSNNKRIRDELHRLFYSVLNVEQNMWSWFRNMCKYGNHYLLLDIDETKGITNTISMPVHSMFREEGDPENPEDHSKVTFTYPSQNLEFQDWQIAHFRLIADEKFYPYGVSMLESARRVWKQLMLTEDAMIVYRITRAPERRVFYIDVGNIDPKDIKGYMQNIRDTIKKTPITQQSTGNIHQRYNPMAIDEDFFIPRRGDKNSEIETLDGASNLDEIADIEYLQNKMFAALKVPKAFLTYEEEINAKATLASQDSRFARTINRLQLAMKTELKKLALVHLYTIGFRDRDQLLSFDLELANPNDLLEEERIELWSRRAGVLGDLWDPDSMSPVSFTWAMRQIFNFTDDEIKTVLNQQFIEGKIAADLEDNAMSAVDVGLLFPADAGDIINKGGRMPLAKDGDDIKTGVEENYIANIDELLNVTKESQTGRNMLSENSEEFADKTQCVLDIVDTMVKKVSKK